MKDIRLNATESKALKVAASGDVSDPVGAMRKAGVDVTVFFEFGDWRLVDFTRSDLTGISFRGSDMRGAKVTKQQLAIIEATHPFAAPDLYVEDTHDSALSYPEADQNFGFNTDDQTRLVVASRKLMAEAFDGWSIRRVRRAISPSRQADISKFEEAIRDRLMSEIPFELGIPRSRSGWAGWRSRQFKRHLRLRLDVCRAVFAISGVDPTLDRTLLGEPVNHTDFAVLGAVRLLPASSHGSIPSGGLAISIDALSFSRGNARGASFRSFLPGRNHRKVENSSTTVRLALREATIAVEPTNSIEPLLKHIKADDTSALGSTSNIDVMLTDQVSWRWRLQPSIHEEVLQGRLDSLLLASVKPQSTSAFKVSILARRSDVLVQVFESDRDSGRQRDEALLNDRIVERYLQYVERTDVDDEFVVSTVSVSTP